MNGLALLPGASWLPRWLVMAVILLTTAGLWIACQAPNPRNTNPEDIFLIALAVVVFASAYVGIRCSSTICAERERRAWEPLLLTDLETEEIVCGKHRAVLQSADPYLVAYAVPAIFLSLGHPAAAIGMALLVLLTRLGMHFMGAVGIWCSATAKSSWRSLLATLGCGFGYAFAIVFATFMLLGMVGVVLGGLVIALPVTIVLVPLVILGAGYGKIWMWLQVARSHLEDAAHHIDRHERQPARYVPLRLRSGREASPIIRRQ